MNSSRGVKASSSVGLELVLCRDQESQREGRRLRWGDGVQFSRGRSREFKWREEKE